MATGENSDDEGQTQATHEPRECMPCRGSGKVISNLGGAPSTVACPWCAGSGVRVPGSDAQSGWPVNEPPKAAVDVPAAPSS